MRVGTGAQIGTKLRYFYNIAKQMGGNLRFGEKKYGTYES